MLAGVNFDVELRYGYRCIPEQSASPAAASLLTVADAQSSDRSLDDYLEAFSLFVRSVGDSPENSYAQAEQLTRALSALQGVPRDRLESVIDELSALSFDHMRRAESLPGVARYNANLSVLLRLIARSGGQSAQRSAREFVSAYMLVQSPEEIAEDFALRRESALEFFDATGIAVLYWDEFLDLSPAARDGLSVHYDLLERIASADDDFAPGRDYARLLIVRDDVGATADTAVLWLPPLASFRAFVHETGHVIHLTDPELRDSFGAFEALYDRSVEGDFFTEYHTDAKEDFAEMYTELAFNGSTDRHPVERAFERARIGKPLMLEKIAYFMDRFGERFGGSVRMQRGQVYEIKWQGSAFRR